MLSSLIFGKRYQNSSKGNRLSTVGVVEELFEEGSAMLAERYLYTHLKTQYLLLFSQQQFEFLWVHFFILVLSSVVNASCMYFGCKSCFDIC